MRQFAAVSLLVFAVAAPAADLTTLSGKKLSGELAAVTAEGVTLKTAEGEVLTPLADVLLIELGAENLSREKFTQVELTDGSVLACTAVALKGAKAELTLVGGPVVTAPLAAVGTLLRDAQDPAVRREWQ